MKKVLGLLLAIALLAGTLITGPACVTADAAGVRQDNLPDHMVVGYWHNFINGSSNLKLRDVPSYYDLVCIAFTENTAVGGRGTFSVDPDLAVALGGYTKEEMIQDIKLLQKRGQHVIISVGGALGRISIRNEEEARNFADSMTAIIREYGLEGIDIDLEGGSVSATAYIASSLRTMHNTFGKDFIITMAPETLYIENEERPYAKLLMEVKDILTVVFPQFYNTGCMEGYDGQMVNRSTADMMTSMSTTLIERFGLRDDQIAFGVPNNPKSAGSGYYTYAETRKAVKAFMNGTKANKFTAPHAYPGFRGMMAWSVNWDNTTNYAWAKSMSALMDEVSGYAPKSAPTAAPNVKIEAGEERVKLSWASVPGAESYEIYDASGKLIMNTSCNFYVVPNLENGRSYSFTVKAANAAGTGAASASVSATPKDFPDVYPFYEDFKPTKEYSSGGTRVNYKGNVYENKYYTAGSTPDGNDAWKLIGPYLYNGDGFGNGGSAGNTPNPNPVKVQSVSLDKNEFTMEIGKVGALKATILPADADDKSVTWESSDDKVVAVSDGRIVAVKEGTAVVKVITSDGHKTAQCKVTVTAPKPVAVESVKLNKTSLTLEAGKSALLTAAVLPADAADKTVTWTSSDEKVATVVNGKVTAVAAGSAVITVTTKDGAKTAECRVTVPAPKPVEVSSVKLSKNNADLQVGESVTLRAAVAPANAENKTLTWHSSNAKVASVVNGKITAKAEGTAVITVKSVNGKTDSCVVNVEPVPTETTAPTDPVPTETEPVPTETEPVPTETDPVPTDPEPTNPPIDGEPWTAGVSYVKGDVVVFEGKEYVCRQPNTALDGWEPTKVPALWLLKDGDTPVPTDPAPTDPEPTDPAPTDPEPTDPEPTDPEPTEPAPTDPAGSEWAPNVTYQTGDVVTYKGVTYSCVQGHTALSGWEPCNVPALWAAA